MTATRALLLAAAFLAGLAGCVRGEDRSAPSVTAPLPPQGAVPQASLINTPPPPSTYQSACGTCHANGGFAVRVLSDRLGQAGSLIHERADLHAETVQAIVRNGLGAMPPMSKVEVSDADLESITAYLRGATIGGTGQ